MRRSVLLDGRDAAPGACARRLHPRGHCPTLKTATCTKFPEAHRRQGGTILRLHHLLVLLTLFYALAGASPAYAETKVITAEATYTMGDGESPSFAEAMVLQKAKQTALEQAGTYVESYTKIQNYDLTTEEIQTIAAGVLEVEVLEKSRTLVGDGLRFSIKIKATVTTDQMGELARRIRGKNVAEEYKKLQEDYAKLTMEIEIWKQLAAKTPPGPDRDAAVDQIREQEKAFASMQRREIAFYQQLFSGEGILSEAAGQLSKKQAHKEILEDLVQWIATKGYHLTHRKPAVNTSIKNPGRAKVTIPVSVALTLEAKNRIAQVA